MDLSEEILVKIGTGMDAYTESNSIRFIREAVVDFIDKRDDIATTRATPADPEKIFLTTGASDGVKGGKSAPVGGPGQDFGARQTGYLKPSL